MPSNVCLVPENVRRTQVACVQAVAKYGSELWWKGEKENGTIGRASDLQKFWSTSKHALSQAATNQGELMQLSGLRLAHSLFNNRGRLFALRMASLPRATRRDSSSGPRAKSANVWSQREAHPCARTPCSRRTSSSTTEGQRKLRRKTFARETDGSRQDNGAYGYSVVWGERPARLANQPGSLRCRMSCNSESVRPGSGATATLEATR